MDLLQTRQADKSERHRSLHAAVDWSVRLLTGDQRALFAALSIFRGGWTTEAAQVVCEQPDALEYLSQLRDRSLIFAEESGGRLRWRMLETLREFGEELLAECDREETVARHGRYFDDFAASRLDALLAGDIAVAESYDAEHNNFRAALERRHPRRRRGAFPLVDPLLAAPRTCPRRRRVGHSLSGSL